MRIADWIFAALLLVAFFPALVAMSEVWSRLDYYSHGYLVPAVALWAASGQRHLLPGLPVSREPGIPAAVQTPRTPSAYAVRSACDPGVAP